ncbi:MAG: hypothetical protein L6R41_003092 [Letrouitia leprolyta]|nr:MAG: hypothetical protein L6R41_003092 [Letrouitia leprolyta]
MENSSPFGAHPDFKPENLYTTNITSLPDISSASTTSFQRKHSRLTLSSWLEDEDYACVISHMEDPLSALKDIATFYDDIDCWITAFVRFRCRPPNSSVADPESRVRGRFPSRIELWRIRRALWRFWTMCELAYTNTQASKGGLRTINENAIRPFMQYLTLKKLEEVECIYFFFKDICEVQARERPRRR